MDYRGNIVPLALVAAATAVGISGSDAIVFIPLFLLAAIFTAQI